MGAELQRLLREFEEFESSHNWNPPPPAEASWLPGGASGIQGELTELKGSADWEALLNAPPEQGDFSTLGQLPPPSQPGPLPLHPPSAHLGWPQGQQQVLAKPSPTKPGLDETLMATAFLEAAWHEEPRENLCSSIAVGQGAGNTSLPGEDVMDWDSMTSLSLY